MFPTDQLLDALEVAVVVFDGSGRVLIANRRAQDELAVLGEPLGGAGGLFAADFELFDDEGRQVDGADVPSMRTVRTGETVDPFVLGVRPRGSASTRWFTVASRPLRGEGDVVAGVICTFADVTAERAARAELVASAERFQVIAESAADVVYRYSVGVQPRIDYVNPAVEAMLGYRPQDFYDDASLMMRVTHPDDLEQARALAFDGPADVESIQIRMVRRDGAAIWTEHRVVPLRDDTGRVIAATGIARDVTALKIKEAFLSHRALHDALTGLPNRVLLLDRLEAALARIRRHPGYLAVLYLDLDRFKTVNDNLGHEVGDRLLQVVAQRLQQTLRPSDSVARLGGDEFAAILADLHRRIGVVQVARRLLAVVAEPVDLGGNQLVTTVSIGIAGGGDGEATAGELLRRADFAMYTAKDRGRARAECYEEPDPATADPRAGATGDR